MNTSIKLEQAIALFEILDEWSLNMQEKNTDKEAFQDFMKIRDNISVILEDLHRLKHKEFSY
jgi:hypothetical protein